jgi:hypothetical protein
MGGSVPFGQGGLSVIGGMFDFGGTSDSGTIFAQPLPGGAFVPFSWGNEPGGNVGAGEIINAFTEGGHNPRDL